MKTRIKKIIIVAAALLFLGSGVSFAHNWKDRPHKQRGDTYGHYEKWNRHHRRWYKKQHKRWHYKPNRHHYCKVKRVHYPYYDRRAPHGRTIIGFKVNENRIINL